MSHRGLEEGVGGVAMVDPVTDGKWCRRVQDLQGAAAKCTGCPQHASATRESVRQAAEEGARCGLVAVPGLRVDDAARLELQEDPQPQRCSPLFR